jgi:hypothetical protein
VLVCMHGQRGVRWYYGFPNGDICVVELRCAVRHNRWFGWLGRWRSKTGQDQNGNQGCTTE